MAIYTVPLLAAGRQLGIYGCLLAKPRLAFLLLEGKGLQLQLLASSGAALTSLLQRKAHDLNPGLLSDDLALARLDLIRS